MGTLSHKELKQLDKSINDAKGVMIDKGEVLQIIVRELENADRENNFIVDRIDGIAIKSIYNKILTK